MSAPTYDDICKCRLAGCLWLRHMMALVKVGARGELASRHMMALVEVDARGGAGGWGGRGPQARLWRRRLAKVGSQARLRIRRLMMASDFVQISCADLCLI